MSLARIATRPIRWWQWRRRRACPHSVLEAIYGDEIIRVGWFRLHCLTCGRWLHGHPELARLRREEPA